MHEHSTLHDYLAVLQRRKWLVLLAVVVVPAVAIALSLQQTPKYQSSAEVLLSRQNLSALLNNATDQSLTGDPARLAQTQADLAQVPEVARRTIARAGIKNMTPAEFLATSGVSAKSDADLLVFTVRNRHPSIAARLATLYARSYIGYRNELDTAALTRARREVLDRIATLERSGDHSSALHASLVDKEQQLATMEALQTSNASLIKPAQGAAKIAPKPARNGALGLALGLVLGLGLAFLREGLDTRVRTPESVSRRLGLPVLAQIPQPPRSLRGSGRLAMVDGPDTIYAEPFRILRTNLDAIDHAARTIMVSSAVEGEGKSTTIANLAVAMARAGREVILVDLDFRHPNLGTFFPNAGRQGLADVANGQISLGEALVPVFLGDAGHDETHATGTNGGSRVPSLRFLPAGTLPPNPGEFIGAASVERVLADLSGRADLVLIDSAPMLGIGDALTLASKVDALILVIEDQPGAPPDAPRARARACALPGAAAGRRGHRRRRCRRLRVCVRLRERPRAQTHTRRGRSSGPELRRADQSMSGREDLSPARTSLLGLGTAGRAKPRRRGWVTRRALLVADLVGLVVAFVLAAVMTGKNNHMTDSLSPLGETIVLALSLPLWVVAAKLYGLYDRDEEQVDRSRADDLIGVFTLVTVGSWLVFVFTASSSLANPNVDRLVLFWGSAIALISLLRLVARALCRRHASYRQNAVIVGTGRAGQLVARRLEEHPEYGVNVLGFVDSKRFGPGRRPLRSKRSRTARRSSQTYPTARRPPGRLRVPGRPSRRARSHRARTGRSRRAGRDRAAVL